VLDPEALNDFRPSYALVDAFYADVWTHLKN